MTNEISLNRNELLKIKLVLDLNPSITNFFITTESGNGIGTITNLIFMVNNEPITIPITDVSDW